MRKYSPLALAIAGSFFVSPFAFSAEEVAKEEQKIEKIEITGSRIKGVDLEGIVFLGSLPSRVGGRIHLDQCAFGFDHEKLVKTLSLA